MRRVVSTASPARNATWFSWTPTSSSASPAMRASSVSARAGMIASSSCVDPGRSVSLTASRYESVAAITSLPGLEAREDPGEHGARLVARGRTRHLRDGLEQRLRVDREDLRRVDLRQPREVLGAVRVQSIARGAARDVDGAFVRPMLDLHLRLGEQPREVDEQTPRHDDRAFVRRPARRATCAARAPCRSQRGAALRLPRAAGRRRGSAPSSASTRRARRRRAWTTNSSSTARELHTASRP